MKYSSYVSVFLVFYLLQECHVLDAAARPLPHHPCLWPAALQRWLAAPAANTRAMPEQLKHVIVHSHRAKAIAVRVVCMKCKSMPYSASTDNSAHSSIRQKYMALLLVRVRVGMQPLGA